MISFPRTTAVHRRMPKEAFYKRLTLTSAVKEKFVTDIDSIYVENSLAKESLNLLETATVKEVLLLSLWLKKQSCDRRIIEAIARQNPHKLVFMLCYEEQRQLALVFHGKLYQTEWMPEQVLSLEARGFQMDEVWESLVEQIALPEEEHGSDLSLEERLARQEKGKKLEKQIAALQAKIRKEKQLNKQIELNAELKKLIKEIDVLQ